MAETEASSPPGKRSETPVAIPAPVRSCELLGLQGALRIDHKGAIYTLRATSKGGLILTK
jgi:hemin uptake protein HemP